MKTQFYLVVIILLGMQFSSCSLLGYGIGTELDRKHSMVKKAGWREPMTVGEKITVYDNNNMDFTGLYSGYSEYVIKEDTLWSVMLKDRQGKIMYVPYHSIAFTKLKTKKRKNRRWIGLGVGLAIDAAFIIDTMNNLSGDGGLFGWIR